MESEDPLTHALAFFRGQFADTKPHESAYLAPVMTVKVNGTEHTFRAEAIAAELGAVRVSENRYLLPAEKRTVEELAPARVKTRRPPGPNARSSSWPKYRKERKKRLLKPGRSPRTLMIAKEYLTGRHKYPSQAARAAGVLPEGEYLHHTEQRAVRMLATEILRDIGLDDKALGELFLEMRNAKTTKFFPYKTQRIVKEGDTACVETTQVIEEREITDNETRRFTMDKLAAVRSWYPKESEQASEGPAKMEIIFQQVQGADGKQAQGMTVRMGGKPDE